MSTATTQTQEYTTLELLTLSGPEYRRVSTAPPRKPTPEEIPVIDLREINGDAGARKSLAAKVRAAAEKTGFFYISNHGIPEAVIQSALGHLQQFFAQPLHKKEKISNKKTGLGIGYNGVGSTHLNRSESRGWLFIFSGS
jgi:hypothetical protein